VPVLYAKRQIFAEIRELIRKSSEGNDASVVTVLSWKKEKEREREKLVER